MSQPTSVQPVVVGIEPWLPWPLSAWSWWTKPVPAERLAILRIGLAAVLLVDLAINYQPHVEDFFGKGALGSPELFDWYSRPPRWNWSLLRGVGDPLLSSLAMIGWIAATVWIGIDFAARLGGDRSRAPARGAWAPFLVWNVTGALVVLGTWSRTITSRAEGTLPWAMPMGMLALALAFLVLEYWRICLTEGDGYVRLAWLLGSCGFLAVLTFAGMFLPLTAWAAEAQPSLGHRLLLSWQLDPVLLRVAFWAWFGATVLLLLGAMTRFMAVATWVFSISFAHVNPYIDNAGDVVRSIILFYLMLCPCGAAWSVDACLQRRRTGDMRPVYVSPWPLRLLFVQMTFIYFFNGLYKMLGPSWILGESLYFVLNDVTLNRVPFDVIRLPYWMTQVMGWTVLFWELGFPLWVSLRWTRAAALVFGVLFHAGIFLTMELGGFGPYMLTLYLPLLPFKSSCATSG